MYRIYIVFEGNPKETGYITENNRISRIESEGGLFSERESKEKIAEHTQNLLKAGTKYESIGRKLAE